MSCVIQLLHKMEHSIRSLDNGNDVDIVYMVRHLIVFHTNMYCKSWKLMVFLVMFWIGLWTFYQIDYREWFMFWLMQCYKLCSTRECAWSSPLYCLYKRLIPEVVQSNIAIFADDTKLYIYIYVTGFGKTDHIVTIDISRNTDLKYRSHHGSLVLDCSHSRFAV